MIKLIFLLIIITLFSLSLAWLAEEPGIVAIDWGVYHLEMSMLTLIAAVALLAAVYMTLYLVLIMMLRTPKRLSQARGVKRQTLGITALTETFAAIAAQDMRGAKRALKRAEHLMPDQPLTLMLASQVARLEGNHGQSQLYLERMSKTGMTEFLALRGLVDNARRSGDSAAAIEHAQKAYALKPHDQWLATSLIGLYSEAGRTTEALKLLERAARKRVYHADEVHQMRAALMCAQGQRFADEQQPDSAISILRQALKRHPSYVPAMMKLVDIHLARNEPSSALNVAHDGWKRVPHPELGEALLRCFDAVKDKARAAKLLQKLAKRQADSPEAQVLMAGLALRQKDYASARSILKQLVKDSGETSRLCTLLANIEKAEENHDQEAYWMRRASESPSGVTWMCKSCSKPASHWEVACPQCGSIGGIV